MSSQPKKKRAEDQPLPVDAGAKPIQLQRRRVWRACESCRRKKIKCDGNEPTCTQCSASGSQCTWLQTKDRAALSRHYVQELEARLLHMENLFTQVAPVLDRNGELPPGLTREGVVTAPNNQRETSGSPATTPQTAPHSAEPNVKVEDELEEPFGQLTLDEHGHMRWIGGSSTISLINSFRYLTSEPRMRLSPLEGDTQGTNFSANKLFFPAAVFFGKIRALPGPEEVEYPERDLANKLVDAYFSRLHCLMPIVDKPSFLSKYKTLMENTSNADLHRSQTAFISLVFAMFACAARLVDDPRLKPKKGDNLDDGGVGMIYYERALILHHISHASIQPAHVQCLLLMSSFLCSVNCLPQAWLIIGQAVRSAQDLGLHRSPRRLQIPAIEKETRRKIWWGVYTMDRMLALALGRPLGVDDNDCDVEPIAPVDDEDLPAYFNGADISSDRAPLMAGTLALHQLYHIAGRVLRQVYSIENTRENLDQEKKAELLYSVERLDQELTKWCDDLPVVLKSSPQTERDVAVGAILCSHYYLVINTLHRNFLPVKRDHIAAPRSVSRAVASSRACIALAPSISHIIPPSHHLAFFIQNLFSSVVIILLFAMHTNDEASAATAMDAARSSLAALEGWEGVWPGARKCRELLSDLAQTTAEAIRATSTAPQAQVPAPPLSLSTVGMQPQPMQIPGSPLSPSTRWEPSPLGGNGRVVRNKPRRDRSHDPYSHSRQSSRSGAGFRDAIVQRARSASRRRPLEEEEGFDTHSAMLQYPGISNHSSPASVRTAPSPKATPEAPHAQPGSPSLNSPTFGLSQVHIASPARPFEYAFGLASPTTPVAPPSGLGSIGSDWANAIQSQQTGTSENNLMYFAQTGGDDTSILYGAPTSPALGTLDPSFYGLETGFGATLPVERVGSTSSAPASAHIQAPSTPPWATFATPGLPFPGLDLLRNYDPAGGNPIFDESLWQTIDPSAFRDPELPWSLGELAPIDEGAQTHK